MQHAKLWKRILHGGLSDAISRPSRSFRDLIIKAPIVVDSRPSDRLRGVFDWSRFASVVFPFEEFWVETEDAETGILMGALVKSGDRRDDGTLGVNIVIVQSSNRFAPTAIAAARFRMYASGGLILGENDTFSVETMISPALEIDPGVDVQNVLLSNIDNALDTLMLLGCKNVSLAPHDNDPKDTRVATKRHGPSNTGYRYHTLVVRPAGSKPGTPGVEIGNMPRHVCRGHFSEYGPEYGKGLLFGKHAGRFFVPPHLKGKAENGIVEKDYLVKA